MHITCFDAVQKEINIIRFVALIVKCISCIQYLIKTTENMTVYS